MSGEPFQGSGLTDRGTGRIEEAQEREELPAVDGLVERDPERAVSEAPEVHPRLCGAREHGTLPRDAGPDPESVEEVPVEDLVSRFAEPGREDPRQLVHASGDPAKSVRAVIDGVHRGHDGEKHLGRADVRGGPLPPDVLLACLECHPERGRPRTVARDPDDPAGNRAAQLGPNGKERGMGPAEAHRYAEALAASHRDVGAEFTRWREQGEGEEVGDHGDAGARIVRFPDARPRRPHLAAGRRIREQDPEGVVADALASGIECADLDPEGARPRLDDGDRLRVAALVDEEDATAALRPVQQEGHRLGGRAALVQQ